MVTPGRPRRRGEVRHRPAALRRTALQFLGCVHRDARDRRVPGTPDPPSPFPYAKLLRRSIRSRWANVSNGLCLARPPQDRAVDLAVDDPVDLGQPGAENVVDPDLPRERFHLERQRRGRDHDPVPTRLVGVDQSPRLWIQGPSEGGQQQPLAELLQIARLAAAEGPDADSHEPVEVGDSGDGLQADQHQPRRFDRRHVSGAGTVLHHRQRGVAVDQRAVEVEERSDLRPAAGSSRPPRSGRRPCSSVAAPQDGRASVRSRPPGGPGVGSPSCDRTSSRRSTSWSSLRNAARPSESAVASPASSPRLAASRRPVLNSSAEHGLWADDPPLELVLASDPKALDDDLRLGDACAGMRREPVGDDPVGLQERAQHAVGHQCPAGGERCAAGSAARPRPRLSRPGRSTPPRRGARR